MRLWPLLTSIVTISSVVLIGLNWLRGLLAFWIAPQNRFWAFYDKIVKSIEYVSLSRGALGRSGTLAQAVGVETPDLEAEKRRIEAARI